MPWKLAILPRTGDFAPALPRGRRGIVRPAKRPRRREMAENVYVADIAQHEGREVTLRGWLQGRRSSGKLHFLQLRDGTGTIQCVVFKGNVSPEAFTEADHLPQETALAHRVRDRRPGTRRPRPPGPGVPHRPQGARRGLPHGAAPPLAPLPAPERDPPRAPHRGEGH